MIKIVLRSALIALTLGLAPLSLVAQRAEAPQGWIGISFQVATTTGVRGSTVVTVTEVNRGSPAYDAGLRSGDRLIAINGVRDARGFNNLADRLHLDPGDEVHITFTRDGRRHQVDLRAADRATSTVTGPRVRLRFQPDSMVESMFRAMDSLRLRLVEAREGGIRVVRSPEGVSTITVLEPQFSEAARERTTELARNANRWRFPDPDDFVNVWLGREVTAPFEFFVFRGEQNDSLEREMDELNDAIRQLQTAERDRVGELRRTTEDLRRASERDSELRRVRTSLEELSWRSSELRTAMEEAARTTAEAAYAAAALRVAPGNVGRSPERSFGPLTPYLLGQNMAAGAKVIDLRPGLAEYFEVEGGVLVVEVPERTPAAIADIRAGDVITRIDQVVIRSVQDLRLGLSRAGETIPVTLIRQGASIQVLLRR